MQSAPLFPVALGIIGGIALDQSFPGAPWIYLLGLAGVTVVSVVRRTGIGYASVLVFIAATCVGGIFHQTSRIAVSQAGDGLRINASAGTNKRLMRVRGVVASQPTLLEPPTNPFQRWTYGKARTLFLLDVESISESSANDPASPWTSRRLRVSIDEPVLDLRQGERVEVFGWMYALRPRCNPGNFDWAALFRRQGIVGKLYCAHRESLRRVGDGSSESLERANSPSELGWPGFLARTRATVRAWLTDDLASGSDEEATLLEAMILGHRSRLDRRINELFIRAGCIHFLAVSGIHVVIVMLFARLLARLLRLSPSGYAWCMMAAVIGYAVIAEPRPSILRASVLAVLYCVALLLGRQRSCLNWISASAVLLLAFDPEMLFDIGFQLSFVAVLGVSYLTPAIMELVLQGIRCVSRILHPHDIEYENNAGRDAPLTPRGRGALAVSATIDWVYHKIPTALAVTVAAWLSALPIVAIYFQRVQLHGAVNSLLVLLPVTIVMGLGFAKIVVTALLPQAGSWVGGLLASVDSWLIAVVEWLGAWPGSDIIVSAPPWWLVVVYYAALLSIVWRFPLGARFGRSPRVPLTQQVDFQSIEQTKRMKHFSTVSCVTSLGLLVVAGAVWGGSGQRHGELRITALAVGSGSATVIELPDGRTIIYDIGTSSPNDIGRSSVVPFLRHRGISRVDRVYLSHPNLDHYSGLPGLIEGIDTGSIVINEYFKPRSSKGSPSRYLLNTLKRKGYQLETLSLDSSELDNRIWRYGGVEFEILSPRGPFDESLSTNDSSTVLRLSYLGQTILLTGDIEERTQRQLLQRGGLGADVLFLPHHGSVRPSSRTFLNAVSPKVLICSSGRPLAETYSNLQELVEGYAFYNTADVGAVTLVVNDHSLHVETMR
jgi:competence protein ComEC